MTSSSLTEFIEEYVLTNAEWTAELLEMNKEQAEDLVQLFNVLPRNYYGEKVIVSASRTERVAWKFFENLIQDDCFRDNANKYRGME